MILFDVRNRICFSHIGTQQRLRRGGTAGSPIVEVNAKTGMTDYFGPMVNRAARVASAARGGQVFVSETAFAAARAAMEAEGVFVEFLGPRSFKGIEEDIEVYHILPHFLQVSACACVCVLCHMFLFVCMRPVFVHVSLVSVFSVCGCAKFPFF